jgi:hypothetical protein
MILFSTLFSIKAQFSIGINAGYNINHLETNISNRSYTKNTNENGYNYGLKLSYHLTHVLNMQTGLDLMQKNYSVIRTGDYLGIYEIFDNSYFQIPITAQFKLFGIRRMSFLINTGVYGAYWFYSKITGTIPNILNSTETISNDGQITQNLTLTNFVEKYQFNSKVDNRFEYGFNTGLELNYKVNNNHSIFGGLNFYQSLTDQQKKYMVNQISKRNQTLCIAIGYSYKFFTD